jgi:hypothetical protein
MQTTALKSTSLAEVGYEREESLLRIQFQSGAIYEYFDVPANVYEDLLHASSAGRFFNENVNGEFDFQRL